MKVSELITLLSNAPPDAMAAFVYDGAARGEVVHVWLTRDGKEVLLADCNESVMYDQDRPASAPSVAEQKHWSTPHAKESI